MKSNELVSIVIPAYNVEKYIDRCIESVTKQSYSNIEIIIVDDGSVDKTPEICEFWKKKDSRIKVIHKENAGLGMARNTGIEYATGKYIEFLDADDFIDRDTVRLFIESFLKYEADAVFSNHSLYFSDNKKQNCGNKNFKLFSDKESIQSIIFEMIGTLPEEYDDTGFEMSTCMGMYSLQLIKENNISFKSEREFISEDLLFNIVFLSHANICVKLPNHLYYYRVNDVSLTRKYNPERFCKIKKMYCYISKTLKNITNSVDFDLRLKRYMLYSVRVCISQIANSDSKHKFSEISKICNDPMVISIIKDYPYNLNPTKKRIFNKFLDLRMPLFLYVLAKLNRG